MKVYIVKGGHDYEGFEIIHVASTKELAEEWKDSHYAFRYPYEDTKGWDKKWVNQNSDWIGYYDYIEIEEFEIDG